MCRLTVYGCFVCAANVQEAEPSAVLGLQHGVVGRVLIWRSFRWNLQIFLFDFENLRRSTEFCRKNAKIENALVFAKRQESQELQTVQDFSVNSVRHIGFRMKYPDRWPMMPCTPRHAQQGVVSSYSYTFPPAHLPPAGRCCRQAPAAHVGERHHAHLTPPADDRPGPLVHSAPAMDRQLIHGGHQRRADGTPPVWLLARGQAAGGEVRRGEDSFFLHTCLGRERSH